MKVNKTIRMTVYGRHSDGDRWIGSRSVVTNNKGRYGLRMEHEDTNYNRHSHWMSLFRQHLKQLGFSNITESYFDFEGVSERQAGVILSDSLIVYRKDGSEVIYNKG